MSIVTVNVYLQIAATPSTLQRKGAALSMGATTLSQGATQFLTQLSDLTSILTGGIAISTLAWTSNVVTVTTSTPHGLTSTENVTIAGCTPAAYNGTFVATVTGASTFTYPLTGNPGSATVEGTVTNADVAELVAMVTTFFNQGSGVGCYVLELGSAVVTTALTEFSTWLTANPGVFYSFLCPREFDGQSAFTTLVNSYASTVPAATSGKTYFWVTTTNANYTNYTKKSVIMGVEAASLPATEFTLAAEWWKTLSYNPSPTNQVTPLQYSYVQGVTPLNPSNTVAAAYAAANVQYVTTGAEGGISNTMVVNGKTASGDQFTYWYSIDWMQINMDQSLANTVINGSNNPLAPLFYNQNGINTLQAAAVQTANTAIGSGLAIGPVFMYQYTAAQWSAFLTSSNVPVGVLINADPFADYTANNPSNYAAGIYGGIACAYVPQLGFEAIVFNILVSSIPGQF